MSVCVCAVSCKCPLILITNFDDDDGDINDGAKSKAGQTHPQFPAAALKFSLFIEL